MGRKRGSYKFEKRQKELKKQKKKLEKLERRQNRGDVDEEPQPTFDAGSLVEEPSDSEPDSDPEA